MTTNFKEMLPLARGVIVVNNEANKYPDDSLKQQQLLEMRKAGMTVLALLTEQPLNGNYPPQGRVNSSQNTRKKPTERVDAVAQQMLKAGKSPQEIGEVIAALLGWEG